MRSLRQVNALSIPRWRARFVVLVVVLVFTGVLARAFYLQMVNDAFLQAQGEARYSRLEVLQPLRGMVTDREGALLAVSTPMKTLWADPRSVAQPECPVKIAKKAAECVVWQAENAWKEKDYQAVATGLGMPIKELKERLAPDANGRYRGFAYLKRQMPPQKADAVLALNLRGLAANLEYKRFYPAAEVTAHLVGYTGKDGNGLEGFERAYDKDLRGQVGQRHRIKDAKGRTIGEDVSKYKKQQDGKHLTLSIDSKLQYLAYKELSAAVEKHKAKAGALVILDAKTGEVLAMVNVPTYNPNNLNGVDEARRRNRALTDLYEPGSTMKPVAAAIALNSGKFKPTTVINTAPLRLGRATVKDSHYAGAMNVAKVIQVSSNVGASKMALSFKPQIYHDYLKSVGFGERPTIVFPGAVRGRVRPWERWVPIEQATMSYGYGISVSLMQMARAYTIFTSNGQLKPVSFLKQDKVPEGPQILLPETAKDMRWIMEKVTQPGGTATSARIPGYRVAGKTGTAHKLQGRGYAGNKYIGSFVGFAPVSNPRLIVAVMIDEPTAGGYYGGVVAAPVFKNVMKEALRQLGVQPDAPSSSLVNPDQPIEAAPEVM